MLDLINLLFWALVIVGLPVLALVCTVYAEPGKDKDPGQ